jgi:hypothetical protein
MKYTKTLFFIGLLIALVPFFGVPIFWKNVLVVLLGIWVAGISTWAFIEALSDSGTSEKKTESPKGGKKLIIREEEREL